MLRAFSCITQTYRKSPQYKTYKLHGKFRQYEAIQATIIISTTYIWTSLEWTIPIFMYMWWWFLNTSMCVFYEQNIYQFGSHAVQRRRRSFGRKPKVNKTGEPPWITRQHIITVTHVDNIIAVTLLMLTVHILSVCFCIYRKRRSLISYKDTNHRIHTRSDDEHNSNLQQANI